MLQNFNTLSKKLYRDRMESKSTWFELIWCYDYCFWYLEMPVCSHNCWLCSRALCVHWTPLSPAWWNTRAVLSADVLALPWPGTDKSVTYSNAWWKDIHSLVQVCRKRCFLGSLGGQTMQITHVLTCNTQRVLI